MVKNQEKDYQKGNIGQTAKRNLDAYRKIHRSTPIKYYPDYQQCFACRRHCEQKTM
jgi:hypothetical protein